MGLIKAAASSIGSTFADQWKEAIQCEAMNNTVILRNGTRMNSEKGSNTKGNEHVISNGSTIMVEENVCMLTIDNGRITNIVTEPGRYTLDNSSAPSIFAGQIKDAAKDLLTRFTYGGTPSVYQKVVYINLQLLPGIKFGTGTPMPYFDEYYNTTIELGFYGKFEVRISDAEMAVRFYREVAGKGAEAGGMTVENVFGSSQYKSEFIQAMQVALSKLSAQGIKYAQILGHLDALTQNVQDATRDNWLTRGFFVTQVGLESVKPSDESKKIIEERLKLDTMLGGDVQKAMMVSGVAHGIEKAASNEGGAMMGFMGMNMAMNTGNNILGQMGAGQPNSNQPPPAPSGASGSSGGWKCVCGAENAGAFCSECGGKKPSAWSCVCGTQNAGKFCSNCGQQKQEGPWKCSCGTENTGKFCSNCGGSKQ